MTIEQLEKIMIEKGATIRAVPMVVVEHWTIQEKDILNCKNEIVYDEKGKPFNKVVKYPNNGGKFLVKSNCNTSSQVHFYKEDKFYNSLQEAINSLI